MSDRKMWFGNRNYMQWIPCPQAGADYGMTGAQQSAQYLHGGNFVRNSANKAKRFSLSWALTERDDIRAITDFVEGVYGQGATYWGDPFTMDKNVLAQSWATPSLGGYDAPVLAGEARPELIATELNSNGFPFQSARYTLTAGDFRKKHWVPIPPGYAAWIGAFGDPTSTLDVAVQYTNGNAAIGAPISAPVQAVTSTNRASISVEGAHSNSGIEVSIEEGSGFITLAGIIVQVLKVGHSPTPGGFISGQGHSGCDWAEMPTREAYSAVMDLVGLSATFVETEQWK